jgi:hypothetical protein
VVGAATFQKNPRNPAAISPVYENIPQKPQKTCAKTAYPLDKKHSPCDYGITASKAAQNLSVNRIFLKWRVAFLRV